MLSSNIFEEEIRYDEKCGTQDICQVSFTADEIVSSPIYLYYQLDNFYQNHRNYVISKSREQLNGEYLSVDDIEDDCDPVVKLKDIGTTIYIYIYIYRLCKPRLRRRIGL